MTKKIRRCINCKNRRYVENFEEGKCDLFDDLVHLLDICPFWKEGDNVEP